MMECERFVRAYLHVAVTLFAAISMASSESSSAIPVEVIREDDGRWVLYRGGKPYFVKGAGVQGVDVSSVAERGGNSIRTWWVDMAQDRLDAAHRAGLTVSLCLPIAAERFGVNYRDRAVLLDLANRVRAAVERFKDHPALLAWIIGNELNLSMADDSNVYLVVNELSKLIRMLDPHHPTTTTLVGAEREIVARVRRDAPDLDFLSVQTYGGIAAVPKWIRQSFKDQPLMLTEWGPLGFWEVARTSWDAPLEQTSTEKAQRLLDTYEDVIQKHSKNIIGSYVFLWGQKQERSPTWFSMHTETGESTEAVDAMQRLWTGHWPANRAPAIQKVQIEGKNARQNIKIYPNSYFEASVRATDPDADPLTYAWSVKRESRETVEGGDFEVAIEDESGAVAQPRQAIAQILSPATPGPYRVYVYVYDNAGHAAHANVPFWVLEPES
ncbi:MAG: hypothetical protein F4W90_00085 [Gammaproteobacteria bacterium]|nr:hypothetical protein [Gammaproteobacteria bacterium]